jgi:lipid A ethanolaminephosphotransferase
VLPSIAILKVRIDYGSNWRGLLSRLITSLSAIVLIAAALFSSAPTFASFFREHKEVRYYTNPLAFVYSVARIVQESSTDAGRPLIAICEDATIDPVDDAPKLVIFVVGETARADHFSLNGYQRQTNPLLEKEAIVNLTNVTAAGTSTAVSVPLMFSHLGREKGNPTQVRHTENLLDVLARVNVSVLWRDNNSDSKGVALRVPFENYLDVSINPPIDGEPRDEGMLNGLQDYIKEQSGDIFIVLHQMGSHGPEYYKRYPKTFEVFTPVCASNQLEKCSQEEIKNAYDNSILYTDYFLSKVIALLKENDSDHQTAMLYFSDHGESLGENNMYLHGYPFAFAPKEQKHVPAVLWLGEQFPISKEALIKRQSVPLSHDNIFHTVLGLFQVSTKGYDVELDFIASSGARH